MKIGLPLITNIDKALIRDRQLRSLRRELLHAQHRGDWDEVEKIYRKIKERQNKVLSGYPNR